MDLFLIFSDKIHTLMYVIYKTIKTSIFDPFTFVSAFVSRPVCIIRNKNVGQFVVSSKKVCFISGFSSSAYLAKSSGFVNQNSSRNPSRIPLHSAYQTTNVTRFFW